MLYNIKKIRSLFCLSLIWSSSLAFAAGDGWMIDYEAARARAQAEKKDLLLDFTGSDWCGWCIKLKEEVFQEELFQDWVADRFVLVEIDFPSDKSKLSEATREQNNALKEMYPVQGFPTILLLDASGAPYASTGYRSGGPEAYVEHLKELQAMRVVRDKAFAAAERLGGTERAKALLEGLKALPDALWEYYSSVTDEIKLLDLEDELGLSALQATRLAREELGESIMRSLTAGDSAAAVAHIDRFLSEYSPEPEARLDLLQSKLDIQARAAIRDGAYADAIALVDTFVATHQPEALIHQAVLRNKVGAYVQWKKFDQVSMVLDQIIALDPEGSMATEAIAFKKEIASRAGKADREPKN
jgi:thioredoxin-related protein